MSKEKLISVSTYAKSIDKSPQWVYHLIRVKKVKSKIIDGHIFVKIES